MSPTSVSSKSLGRTAKQTILLVTNDPAVKKSYILALKNSYNIIDAVNYDGDIDAAILDIDSNGDKNIFDVLVNIKKMNPGSPVIMLASEGDVVHVIKARRLGADDHVLKTAPLSAKSLKLRLKIITGKSSSGVNAEKGGTSAGTGTDFFVRSYSQGCKMRDNVFELGYEEYVRHVQKLVLEYIETRGKDVLGRSGNKQRKYMFEAKI